jgi:hypothetical protein
MVAEDNMDVEKDLPKLALFPFTEHHSASRIFREN